jgi:ABC-type Na+ transport system ATPase subunit NatA
MAIAGILGWPFETIINMTDDLTLSAAQANVNLVIGLSGLSGGKTLTLPAISQMVASQNPCIRVCNKSSSGGTITVACNSANTIIGDVTVPVTTGGTYYHDGISQWFGF